MPLVAIADETLALNMANVALGAVTLGLLAYFLAALIYGLLVPRKARDLMATRSHTGPLRPRSEELDFSSTHGLPEGRARRRPPWQPRGSDRDPRRKQLQEAPAWGGDTNARSVHLDGT